MTDETQPEKLPETLRGPDGIVRILPNVPITDELSCRHMIALDGMALPLSMAVRYLLADRERILTLLADERESHQVGEGP